MVLRHRYDALKTVQLSIAGAILTILTFTIFGDIRTYPIKLIMFLCACIAAGYEMPPRICARSQSAQLCNLLLCLPSLRGRIVVVLASFDVDPLLLPGQL